ncbi:hypothetical protein BDZ91DRAFT_733877 [Kalaharituber pfeilii]|nr:hypothetical protein BDZ91DRAFT_733877 [Kalaharituber pfeilii]
MITPGVLTTWSGIAISSLINGCRGGGGGASAPLPNILMRELAPSSLSSMPIPTITKPPPPCAPPWTDVPSSSTRRRCANCCCAAPCKVNPLLPNANALPKLTDLGSLLRYEYAPASAPALCSSSALLIRLSSRASLSPNKLALTLPSCPPALSPPPRPSPGVSFPPSRYSLSLAPPAAFTCCCCCGCCSAVPTGAPAAESPPPRFAKSEFFFASFCGDAGSAPAVSTKSTRPRERSRVSRSRAR